MKKILLINLVLFVFSCKSKVEKITPELASITESVYASGIVKSKNQYQVYATVSGIINAVLVSEGDTVKAGTVLFKLADDAQRLNKENAQLNAAFADLNANSGKLNEARLVLELAKNKLKNDSSLYYRQQSLWQQNVGTKVELEQRELSYENAKTNYYSAKVKHDDLIRQLNLNSSISKKNLAISSKLENDFSIKSELDGIVYSITKNKGEIVSPQTALAVVGDASQFILEMQVDEYDILKIKKGQRVIVALDSYKGKTFEATVTKINPLMNERNKTFIVEANFNRTPEMLYPNISLEANIVLQSKEKVLLIPRNCLLRDSLVVKATGDTVVVKTGLRDYQKIEILSGLNADDELIVPKQ